MRLRATIRAALAATCLALPVLAQSDPRVLRAVIPGELRSLDPVWTTAEQTRYHAFMVYDTLLGLDEQLRVQPQMVDRWTTSEDQLTWTFTLREGLRFSDGAPVTAEDVVASWRRWMVTDAAGQMTNTFLASLEAADPRTVRAVLKEPFGLLLFALAKPMAMPMFVMPARLAGTTPASVQITDPTGSGPFIMRQEERVAGSRTVYVRNPGYVPRAEPASGIAGGKRVNVERVEWINIPDAATQVAALQRGEVDLVSTISYDLAPVLQRSRGITIYNLWNTGTQGILRLNHLNPPFDNAAIRRAIQHFVIQPDLIMAITGDLALGQVCGALLICGSPNGSEHGTEAMRSTDAPAVRRARGIEAMRAAGYRGEQIIILHPTDQPIQNAATLVLADSLRAGGVNVDVQAMDWATLVTRRAVREPGPRSWHIFMTLGGPMGPANPALHIPMSAACERAWFGWPCDERLEQLRAQWVRTTDPARAFAIAEDIQRRAMDITLYLSFGQFMQPAARRDALEGFLRVPETIVFWNVSKRS